ncbi:tetratricopeptide repeat protein [Bifidobacterium samirii]|nr:tetratricopeptide repeat protein [Bifidobacterium samirii]
MFSHASHQGNHGRSVSAAIGRLVRSVNARFGAGRTSVTVPSTDPFSASLNAPDGDMVKSLHEHAIVLGPLVKRRVFDGLEGVPDGLRLGWAQLPVRRGSVLALGAFTSRDHFAQIALADDKGRVFVGSDPEMDVQGKRAQFMFGKEGRLRLPDGPRFGHKADPDAPVRMLDVFHGGIVGRDDSGRMMWLASWLKTGNRYTLEQVRQPLPDALRHDLGYRDAIAVAFFTAYMLPQMKGLLIGFGSGNIFRRLNREAPIGAIRRSLRDTLDARAHGLRASGLEDHFADLMHEAKALEPAAGLEAVHGAEPLHLYTSSYSGNYFFTWDSGLQFPAALQSLRIEANLNRFAAVSAWLERNARLGVGPIEDTVTRAEAARIDRMLLEDPALNALKPGDPAADDGAADTTGTDFDGDGWHAVMRLVDEAQAEFQRIAERNPDPVPPPEGHDPGDSEWLYRQTVARLLRRLRLPYRFDVEFRSDLASGEAAVGYTVAGPSMMPSTLYDDERHAWTPLDEDARAAMSADYNLRVGLMIAAMMFGANRRVKRISVHVDSLGLEEAAAAQDSAISDMMGQTLRRFERTLLRETGVTGGKADPKDGDHHGDPALAPRGVVEPAVTPAEPFGPASPSDASALTGVDDTDDAPAASIPPADGIVDGMPPVDGDSGDAADVGSVADEDASVDRRFEDLMRGIDFDETLFTSPDAFPGQDDPDAPAGPSDGSGMAGAPGFDGPMPVDPSDPLSALRADPTVRTMATVTFTRDEFLERLYEDGLLHPADTFRLFDAVLAFDEHGALAETEPAFALSDGRFAPTGAQEEPELSDTVFRPGVARVLGAADAAGLSIQRADLLQHGVAEFHRLAADHTIGTAGKAREAMRLIERIGDPELTALAPQVTSALIDGEDTPDFRFTLNDDLGRERDRAHEQFFAGQLERAIETLENELERIDRMYAAEPGVPRYFNSYAERVVYNRLFATSGERTVLIPDDLFYTHMEAADLLAQIKGPRAALPHLNAMVSYAPAYPLSHLKLAVQLARLEDWDSARAACLNALRVALDRDDAAFAYYRFAYCAWMHDRFDEAAAGYLMSEHISPGQIGALEGELRELVARAESQCIPLPDDVDQAKALLASRGLPVWPATEVASIMREAARASVDAGMFVPARTLSVACARMADDDSDGIDVIQAQFLRSLNA